MRQKIRAGELEPGDVFEMLGKEYTVESISPVITYYSDYTYEHKTYAAAKRTMGCRSMQFVWKISNKWKTSEC